MYDFTAVVGEFGGLVGGYDWYKAGCGHFSWIGGENAIDFFPYLEFGGIEADGKQCCEEVRVAPADLAQEGARNGAKETWAVCEAMGWRTSETDQ